MPHEAPKYFTDAAMDAFLGLVVAIESRSSGITVAGHLVELCNVLIANRDGRPRPQDVALARAITRLP